MKSGLTFDMTNNITLVVNVAKVTISIESNLLKKVDRLVKERAFANCSQAVQSAVEEKVSRLDRNLLPSEKYPSGLAVALKIEGGDIVGRAEPTILAGVKSDQT
jgi:Arc/MetJ-type ribon-helix-helix transcriptional regulator